jgi:hypothetical protein
MISIKGLRTPSGRCSTARRRQTEHAIVAFRQVLASHPDSVMAKSGIAKGEYLAGRGDDEAREYERVLQATAGSIAGTGLAPEAGLTTSQRHFTILLS